MEKMIKVLLFTYGREVPNPQWFEGAPENVPEMTVVEGLARLGEVVDVTRPYDLDRGERAGAFYTDEERAQIEDGTYKGVDHAAIYARRLSEQQATVQDIESETGAGLPDIADMSSDEIGQYIVDHKVTVPQMLEWAGDPAEGEEYQDRIEKLRDAENHAAQLSEADPRKGVVDGLDARLAAATTG